MGKFNTVSWDSPQFPHQWGNSIPFLETVLNFPTGGEIRYRFSRRSSISPPVGKFNTIFWDGPQFPHSWGNCGPSLKTVPNFPTHPFKWTFFYPWWGNWEPFFETVLNFPTRGEIEDRSQKRYSISPLTRGANDDPENTLLSLNH